MVSGKRLRLKTRTNQPYAGNYSATPNWTRRQADCGTEETVHASWHRSDRRCAHAGDFGREGTEIFHGHGNQMPSDRMAFLLELKYF